MQCISAVCFGPVIAVYDEFKFTNVGTAVVSLSVSVKSLLSLRILLLRQNLLFKKYI